VARIAQGGVERGVEARPEHQIVLPDEGVFFIRREKFLERLEMA
jgi:hypothetical protein